MEPILKEVQDAGLGQSLLREVIRLADRFKEKYGHPPAYMEVCGSHTHALARTGIKRALKDHVRLISGPGCPVCVTDQKTIDAMIALTEGENRIICTFGDMLRIPGSKGSLLKAKTEGKDIRVVYSPSDSVRIAKENPDNEVIFLGVGFETTIPVLGIALKEAWEDGVKNFSMWVTTKLVEPVVRYLLDSGEAKLDGFLLPGHVSVVLGKNQYSYLVDEYGVPGVISGFEMNEMLSSIYLLIELGLKEEAKIINNYKSVVKDEGNPQALTIMETFFTPNDEAWRGIGVIPKSGLDIREEYRSLNAKIRFPVTVGEPIKTKCRCGEIIRGLVGPEDCPLFGKACTPMKPIGPCMVSSEGSCSAHYKYLRE
ncbi:hydrogenase formation protein HypD [Thermicanus aegyptius]|uniref:hydrogenase formation protein HypD n=1 Tax=Thermicanus aegyptius TaxID=94009 RepID=UPI0003FDF6BF|nr:hydrogenase formation protein HypD [Thermicanus aegyptius]